MNHKPGVSHDEIARRYQDAKATILAERRLSEGEGYGLMAGALGFGEVTADGYFRKVIHAAEVLCISFAFIAPVLMFWAYTM